MPQCILIFKTWLTPNSAQSILYIYIKSTGKCAHIDLTHTLPSSHPHSTLNGQYKASYECLYMEISCLLRGLYSTIHISVTEGCVFWMRWRLRST